MPMSCHLFPCVFRRAGHVAFRKAARWIVLKPWQRKNDHTVDRPRCDTRCFSPPA